jgi:hypothetical protein
VQVQSALTGQRPTVAKGLRKRSRNGKASPRSPWAGTCSQSCWYALGKRCNCRCGGAHHGGGRVHSDEIYEEKLGGLVEATA